MANNTGATCIRCGKGHYKAFDLNDDIFGDLRCNNCRHHVKFNQNLMAELTSLSLAAQAVLDAYKDARDGQYVNGEWIQDEAGQVAAALRAVADQVVPELWHEDNDIYGETMQDVRGQLLAIAAELEGVTSQ